MRRSTAWLCGLLAGVLLTSSIEQRVEDLESRLSAVERKVGIEEPAPAPEEPRAEAAAGTIRWGKIPTQPISVGKTKQVKVEILGVARGRVPVRRLMTHESKPSAREWLVVWTRWTNVDPGLIWNRGLRASYSTALFVTDSAGNKLKRFGAGMKMDSVASSELGAKHPDTVREGESFIDVDVFQVPVRTATHVQFKFYGRRGRVMLFESEDRFHEFRAPVKSIVKLSQ